MSVDGRSLSGALADRAVLRWGVPRIRLLPGHLLGPRVLALVGCLIYVLAFRWTYVHLVSPVFAYFGMRYQPLPTSVEAAAVVLLLLFSLQFAASPHRPSRIVLWFVFILVVVPNAFVPLYILGPDARWGVIGYALSICLGFAVISLTPHVPTLRLPPVRLSSRTYWGSIYVACFLLDAYIFVVLRGSLRLVSIMDVYGQRSLFMDLAQSTPVPYVVNILGYVLHPLLLSRGLSARRAVPFLAGAIGQVFLYSAGAHKSFLFSILFLPLVFLLLRGNPRTVGVTLLWSVVGLFGALTAVSALGGAQVAFAFLTLLMMRVFSISGLISAQFYVFFQSHPFTHFSQVHGISKLVEYPYSEPLINLVGRYWTGYDIVANGHFWADGYASWGYLGMMVTSVIVGVVFWMVDSASVGKPRKMILSLLALHGLVLSNASVFTWLVTHGMALLIIMIYLLPAEDGGGILPGGGRSRPRGPERP